MRSEKRDSSKELAWRYLSAARCDVATRRYQRTVGDSFSLTMLKTVLSIYVVVLGFLAMCS